MRVCGSLFLLLASVPPCFYEQSVHTYSYGIVVQYRTLLRSTWSDDGATAISGRNVIVPTRLGYLRRTIDACRYSR